MNLEALATGTPVAAVALAASHLTGRQVVPGLVVITLLLLALVIAFGPRDRDRDKDPGGSRTAGRPVHAADLRDPAKDVAGTVPGE